MTRQRRPEASGAALPGSEHEVRLVRRRPAKDKPWSWRAVCKACGPLGGGYVKAEAAATSVGFEHARLHREPTQLRLELEEPLARGKRRRR